MNKCDKPILIYDGDCGFCTRWVKRWKRITRDAVDYAPYQEIASQFPEVLQEEFERAVQFIEPGGKRVSGAEAAFRALATTSRFFRLIIWKYEHVPGFAWVSECVYRFVSKHRSRACFLSTQQ